VRVVGAALFAGGLLVVPLASAASFGRPAEIPLVRAPTAVVDADATQDGIEDLVIANAAGPTLTVLPGKQDGSFDRSVDIGTGPPAGALAVADFDNDGAEDLAVAGGGQIAIYTGGRFARPQDHADHRLLVNGPGDRPRPGRQRRPSRSELDPGGHDRLPRH
jgi:FG-GAP-like repeat